MGWWSSGVYRDVGEACFCGVLRLLCGSGGAVSGVRGLQRVLVNRRPLGALRSGRGSDGPAW